MVVVSLVRASFQTWGLLSMLLAIPLAFDVGGEQCGLAFSLFLSLFYFSLSTIRHLFRHTPLRYLSSTLYYGQFLIIPSLLLVHLSLCPDLTWIERVVSPWRWLIIHSTGLFAILEGFCSLIVIQMCGRVSRHLVKVSDAFQFAQLALASLAISADLYLLVRVYAFPEVVNAVNATLIGAALTISLVLGVYGIVSQRGNVTETTMLFSYIVYQIYLTFTDFQSTNAQSALFPFKGSSGSPVLGSTENHGTGNHLLMSILGMNGGSSSQSAAGNIATRVVGGSSDPYTHHHLLGSDATLPPVIIDSYVALMTTVAELTPTGMRTMFDFLRAAAAAITPSVLVSLVVRLTSFFLALSILPYIRRRLIPAGEVAPPRRRSGMVLYAYSPVIIIAVYTHLLMQHFGGFVHGPSSVSNPSSDFSELWSVIWASSRQSWQFWGWINVFLTLAIYALELCA